VEVACALAYVWIVAPRCLCVALAVGGGDLAGSRRSLSLVPPESFGSRLKTQRQIDDLTQTELGERFSVSQQTIGAWEKGTDRPQSRFFGPLAQYLGLESDQEVVALLDSQPTELSADQGVVGSMADEPVETDAAAMRLLLRSFVRDRETGSLGSEEAAKIYESFIEYFQTRAADKA
jgi:transcriptional regulator with XRE-family HTH domain